jgi:predicted nucleic acid-binding protein
VADYFLDSSAIVKRYAAETGSSWVQGVTSPLAGNRIFIARVTAAEVVSTLVRKYPPLPAQLLAQGLADFLWDYRNQYQRLAINEAVVARAMHVAELHRLRGYDAVQLAAAIELLTTPAVSAQGQLVFVSADAPLLAAATAEGLTVDNPNLHP